MPSVMFPRLACVAALFTSATSGCSQDPAATSHPTDAAASSGTGTDAVASALPDASGMPSGSGRGDDAAPGIDAAPVSGPDASAPETAGTGVPNEAGGAEARAPGWTCPAGPFGSPIPAGAAPARVAGVPPSDAFNMNNGTFGIIEGPVWIGDSLYVSEIGAAPNPPASRVLKISAGGVVSVAVPDSGTNGLAVDKAGNLYGAVHKDGSVSRFDLSTGSATAIASMFMGARFNSPNDLAIRSDGTIYFSDPDYQAPSTHPQSKTRLYRVAPGTNAVSVVDATLSEPNGVTFSLDESALFVTTPGALYKYPVMPDGSVGASAMVTPNVSSGDGMTLDCAGNLYVATPGSIVVLAPSGTEIGRISVAGAGVQSATNVAFGGADHKTLYITALGSGTQKGLLQVVLGVPGLPY